MYKWNIEELNLSNGGLKGRQIDVSSSSGRSSNLAFSRARVCSAVIVGERQLDRFRKRFKERYRDGAAHYYLLLLYSLSFSFSFSSNRYAAAATATATVNVSEWVRISKKQIMSAHSVPKGVLTKVTYNFQRIYYNFLK